MYVLKGKKKQQKPNVEKKFDDGYFQWYVSMTVAITALPYAKGQLSKT